MIVMIEMKVVGITEDTEGMQGRHRGDCLNYDFCDWRIAGMMNERDVRDNGDNGSAVLRTQRTV